MKRTSEKRKALKDLLNGRLDPHNSLFVRTVDVSQFNDQELCYLIWILLQPGLQPHEQEVYQRIISRTRHYNQTPSMSDEQLVQAIEKLWDRTGPLLDLTPTQSLTLSQTLLSKV